MNAPSTTQRRGSALRRPAALIGTAALCLGVLATTPLITAPAQARMASAPAAGSGTDQDHATAADRTSGRIRTKPDHASKGANPASAVPAGARTRIPPKQPEGQGDGGIVGGGTAGSYPSYVALKRPGSTSSFCGGTLVSSVWVLTAAHCVDEGTTTAQLKLVIGAPTWADEAIGDTRSVTSINIHPSWDDATKDNDVALLRLDTPSTKTWARLAEPADPVNAGNTVRVVGHGATTEGGSQSATLLQVDVPIQSDATMSASAQYGSSFHGNVMIGAGPLAGGQDSCQGDSGGPMYANFDAAQPALVGDVSWGTGCARANRPGIYGEVYQGALRTFVNGLVGRPGNDTFAGVGISGADGSVSGNNTDATGQPGEPAIAGSAADTSVWYSWTAPESGPTSFNTRDAAFDTTLGVFTGGGVGSLTSVASNDDINSTRQSKVTFNAVAGTTYRIAVDGFNATFGPFGLQWSQNAPANDSFSSPTALSGTTGKSFQSTARSTGEPGEPLHFSTTVPRRTVWFSWTPGFTGPAVFNTRESNFDTVLAAYSGSSITSLTQLASSDDVNGSRQSKIAFNVTAGTTYRIAVDGFGGATGSLGLQWALSPPPNDDFANATVLPGQFGSITDDTLQSTGEPGELDFHGGAAADNSVWYSWTPTISSAATVKVSAGGFTPGMSVYTGSSLGALTRIVDGFNNQAASFNATAGTTYRIAVDGQGGSTGTFGLDYRAKSAPGAPTVFSSSASPGTVSVGFTAPDDGGSPVLGYNIECSSTDGGVTRSEPATGVPAYIGELTGNKLYHCRAQAQNANGWGPFGAYGDTVLVPPPTAPPMPFLGTMTPSAGAISVAFASFADGGRAITSYSAQCTSADGGVTGAKVGTGSPITVTGLSGGKTYRCRVRARNELGYGPYSTDSSDTTIPSSVPAAPTVTGSAPSAGAVTVAFSATQDGGSAITGYTAQCVSTDGGLLRTVTGTSSPIVVSALSGAKSYHCRVRATNALGASKYSGYGPTVSVPATAPGKPTVTGSTPSAAAVSVAFNPPAADGGSPVTGYTTQCVSTDGGVTRSKTGTSSPILVSGLSSGHTYHCAVRGVNAVGSGAFSSYGPTVLVS